MAYQKATAARLKAEADLTAATFGHDAQTAKIARRALKRALANWRRASELLETHGRSHAMTAGGSHQL